MLDTATASPLQSRSGQVSRTPQASVVMVRAAEGAKPVPVASMPLPGQPQRDVFLRCGAEAAEQIRRGAMSGESPAVRLAAGMLRDAARSVGALVLADVCDRLANARPDKLIDAACQWTDLIERLVEEVRLDFVASAEISH